MHKVAQGSEHIDMVPMYMRLVCIGGTREYISNEAATGEKSGEEEKQEEWWEESRSSMEQRKC